MKARYMVYFFLLGMGLWSTRLFAQPTDVIKIYVLYDISGSVPINDIHQNLRLLGGELIKTRKGASEAPFSVELISFGENAK